MTKMLVPNDGARGIDITTHRGVVKLNADRAGVIDAGNDPALVRALKAEGFTVAGLNFGHWGRGYPCECGFNAAFAVCGRCGKDNGVSPESNTSPDEPSVSNA